MTQKGRPKGYKWLIQYYDLPSSPAVKLDSCSQVGLCPTPLHNPENKIKQMKKFNSACSGQDKIIVGFRFPTGCSFKWPAI